MKDLSNRYASQLKRRTTSHKPKTRYYSRKVSFRIKSRLFDAKCWRKTTSLQTSQVWAFLSLTRIISYSQFITDSYYPLRIRVLVSTKQCIVGFTISRQTSRPVPPYKQPFWRHLQRPNTYFFSLFNYDYLYSFYRQA